MTKVDNTLFESYTLWSFAGIRADNPPLATKIYGNSRNAFDMVAVHSKRCYQVLKHLSSIWIYMHWMHPLQCILHNPPKKWNCKELERRSNALKPHTCCPESTTTSQADHMGNCCSGGSHVPVVIHNHWFNPRNSNKMCIPKLLLNLSLTSKCMLGYFSLVWYIPCLHMNASVNGSMQQHVQHPATP